jgi:hypothetical protein
LNKVNSFLSTYLFNNITFSETLNNINSTVFNYLFSVNSNIQDQFDDLYSAFSSFANLIYENTFSTLNNYFVNINMSGDLTTNNIYSPTIDNIESAIAGINRTSLNRDNVDNTSDINKIISNATQNALNLKLNSADYTVVTKSSLGLNNNNNTSDLNKIISNATQNALNLKLNSVNYTAVTKSS